MANSEADAVEELTKLANLCSKQNLDSNAMLMDSKDMPKVQIIQKIREGKYQPNPVRRIEIPKDCLVAMLSCVFGHIHQYHIDKSTIKRINSPNYVLSEFWFVWLKNRT